MGLLTLICFAPPGSMHELPVGLNWHWFNLDTWRFSVSFAGIPTLNSAFNPKEFEAVMGAIHL